MNLDKIKEKIKVVSRQHSKSLILTGGLPDDRSKYLIKLSRESGKYININKIIAERLSEIPRDERAVEVIDILSKLPLEIPEDYLLLDYLDILFSPEIKVDPFEALIKLSRNKTIIVSWPGDYQEGSLIYAQPGHPEYYYYPDAGEKSMIIEV